MTACIRPSEPDRFFPEQRPGGRVQRQEPAVAGDSEDPIAGRVPAGVYEVPALGELVQFEARSAPGRLDRVDEERSLRCPSRHRKELPDGDAVGMSQPAAPSDRAPLPSVSIVQTSLTPFSDRTKRRVFGPAKEGTETSPPGVGSRRTPPASTGMRLSCDAPETGRVTATMDRPSGENLPGRPAPSRVASPPASGRIQIPDVFSVGPRS